MSSVLDHFENDGELLFEKGQHSASMASSLTGESPYRAGRSAKWLKIRTRQSDDLCVVDSAREGHPERFRRPSGALYVDGTLIFRRAESASAMHS